MDATETKVMTLQEFTAAYAACRLWFTSLGHPTGYELVVDTDDDGEDYCDTEQLLDVAPVPAALSLDCTGTVSRDGDGEYRWEWDGEGELFDSRSNTVRRLIVWGEE